MTSPPPPSAAEYAALQAELREARAEIARLTDQVHELRALVHRRTRKDKKRAEPEAERPAPAGTAEEKKAFEERPKPPEATPKATKPETVQRRPGRSPVPSHLPRNETTVAPGRCPVCGGEDHVIVDTIEEEKLDAELKILQARITQRKVGRCRCCGTRVVPPAPPSPFQGSKLTCQALALIMYLNVGLLLPLDRIRQWFASSMGVPLTMSFLVDMKDRAAQLLDVVDGEHWKQLMRSRWLGVDGTGHKVIIEGLPGTQHAYLEVFRNEQAVVFQFGLNKLGETLAERLAGFTGTVVCDAESRNGVVFGDGKRTEAGCNAHVRRSLDAALAEQPLAAEAIRYVARIYDLHETSVQRGLSGVALLAFRELEIRPVYEQLRLWADAVRPRLLPSDGLAGVLRYLETQWDPLTRWLGDADLPPDNNGCEREFQRVAKGRHSWLFFGGPEGGHRTATLLGIFATCRLHGVEPLGYLVWAFERLGTARVAYGDLPATALTPAAYKATLTPVLPIAA